MKINKIHKLLCYTVTTPKMTIKVILIKITIILKFQWKYYFPDIFKS